MPFDANGSEIEVVCPICCEEFKPKRNDQKYCGARCRKQNYQQKDREKYPRNAQNNKAVKRENITQRARALDLAAMLYELPPGHRLGFMKKLIDVARSGDAKLKSIFTNPNLLNASRHEPWLFHRCCPASYLTISQAANQYCKSFLNSSVGPVVRGEVPEPPTGEVFDFP
jgi:hypothetical protein